MSTSRSLLPTVPCERPRSVSVPNLHSRARDVKFHQPTDAFGPSVCPSDNRIPIPA